MMFMTVEDAVELIRMEYAEMPGLKLTVEQTGRLCNLSADLCDRALRLLVASGFLKRTADNAYVRLREVWPTVESIERLVREAS